MSEEQYTYLDAVNESEDESLKRTQEYMRGDGEQSSQPSLEETTEEEKASTSTPQPTQTDRKVSQEEKATLKDGTVDEQGRLYKEGRWWNTDETQEAPGFLGFGKGDRVIKPDVYSKWLQNKKTSGFLGIGNNMDGMQSSIFPGYRGEYATDIDTAVTGAAAIGDAALGLLQFPVQIVQALRGKDYEPVKLPKFEEESLQTTREVVGVIAPTLVGGGLLTGAARGLQASRVAAGGGRLAWLTKLGADKAFARFATLGVDAGVGAVVDYTSVSAEDDNFTGTLYKNWPNTWGWISPDIRTLDGDSPDVKRQKNTKEGVLLSIFGDLLTAAGALKSNRKKLKNSLKYIPENEMAGNVTLQLNKEAEPKEEVIDFLVEGAEKRTEVLDQVKEFEFNKTLNTSLSEPFDINAQPVFGYHDMWDDYEYAYRSMDDGGVIAASVDLVKIENNIDTVYGRLGSFMSDSVIKNALEIEGSPMRVLQGIGAQLTEVGRYGYKTATGKYLNFDQIDEAGTRLSARLNEMSVADMKAQLKEFEGIDVDTGVAVLNSPAYNAVMKSIKYYLKEYASLDSYKAYAYAATSMAGQVSDLAEGARLMDGTSAVNHAREQILDRIEFLSIAKAQTSYARARALNLTNTVKENRLNPSKLKDKFVDLLEQLGDPKTLEEQVQKRLADIKTKSAQYVETLRNVQKERPEYLDPLTLAYEVTDGDVMSMTRLNYYLENSTSLRKLLIDQDPSIKSIWVQSIWGNIYNSVLSSLVTPLKAGASNAVLMVERPMATFIGAAIEGDRYTIRRGIYQYRAFTETFGQAWGHMNEVFKRAAKDPTQVAYVMRDEIAVKNEKTFDLLRSFADAEEARGNLGPAAMVAHYEELHALERHPWLRFGANAMTAFDGFTRSVIGNVEARGRAFDLINTSGGKLDPDMMDGIAKKAYSEMFDDNGMITDKAVEYASREIAMNLDDGMTRAVGELVEVAPVIKPFLMFPRTSSNMLRFAYTHHPAGLFINKLNQFSEPFERMPIEKVEKLLKLRNISYTPETMRAVYSNIRAEMKGRKAVGMLAVSAAVGLLMNNRLRGDGHYNKTVNQTRKELDWTPRTYQGFDGRWYSLDNLGPIGDWMIMTANVADNIVDGTLDANSGTVLLNKLGFILSASIVNKSFMAGLEPMGDVVAGNPSAAARWAASFGSGLAPLSGMRNDLSRLLTPQLKELEQEVLQLTANRNPGLKDTLPDKYDWIDGGLVGVPNDALTRIWNTFSPWKVSEDISPEKQFLIDIEFDARPTFASFDGVKLSPKFQSAIAEFMGRDGSTGGGFKKAIQEAMGTIEGREFRRQYAEARGPLGELDKNKFQGLHTLLKLRLQQNIRYAIDNLSEEMRAELDDLRLQKKEKEQVTKFGTLEEVRQYNNP
tara:strand:+ start:3297 stop:7481 length:4185 start_codon:yes stop_codon:yes gene_type:complete